MSSSYTGVKFHKGSKNAWRAEANHGGKRISLGSHATEMEAARKYDEWAMQIPGKPLNFPGSRPKRKIADLREKVYSTVRQNLIEDTLVLKFPHRDLELPQGEGLASLNEVKREIKQVHIPVIFSGYACHILHAAALKTGAGDST